MKHFLYAVALLLGMSALFVSCNKNNGGSSSGIVGTWKVVHSDSEYDGFDVGQIYTIEEGGIILFDGSPYTLYHYDASTQTLKMGASVTFKVLSITSKSMEWLFHGYEDSIIKFERQ